MSLPESGLLGISVIVFVIMLFKQCRVLYFFALYTINSIVLFIIRVMEGNGVSSAFLDSFSLVGIGMLLFFIYYLNTRFRIQKKKS